LPHRSRHVGIDEANTDRDSRTRLSTVLFTSGPCKFHGKLVALSGEVLYAQDIVADEMSVGSREKTADGGGVEPLCKSSTPDVPQLSVIRIGDVKDLRVLHYERQAKP